MVEGSSGAQHQHLPASRTETTEKKSTFKQSETPRSLPIPDGLQEVSPLSSPEGLLRRPGANRPGANEKIYIECSEGKALPPRLTAKAVPLATSEGRLEEDAGAALLSNDTGNAILLVQQAKARDQAKRLALEVARLRSSLRATTSELNTERSARVRLEDEWWRKLRAWEEERSCLITSKYRSEQSSRLAEEEVARVQKEGKAREARAVSEGQARESAQLKVESVIKGVVEVQDRLIRALKTELNMTTRAKEAVQDDAREAREQLRLYVQDFLLWRNRAKQLEAHINKLGQPQQPADIEAFKAQQHLERGYPWPEPACQSRAVVEESADFPGSPRTHEDDDSEQFLSIPEKYARYFGNGEVERSEFPNNPALSILRGKGDQQGKTEAAAATAAAAAWSTRSAIAVPSSASSRAHFQRSMQAQQGISARLEKELRKTRAELQLIYARSRDGGDIVAKMESIDLLPEEESRPNIAVSGEAVDVPDGDGGQARTFKKASPKIAKGDNTCNGNVSSEDKGSKINSPHIVEGSHMNRVLAALLGRDKDAAETSAAGRTSETHASSWVLADFPPKVQAVFGEGPAANSSLPAVVCGSQARSHLSLSAERQQKIWARGIPVEVDENEIGDAGEAPADEHEDHPAAVKTAGRVRVGGARPTAGFWEEGMHPKTETSSAVYDVAGERESRSLSGAFRGYEAKSSVLQRWLVERVSSFKSQIKPDETSTFLG